MLEPFSCQQTVNRSRSNLIVKNAVNIVINKCSFTYIWKQVNKFGDLVQPLPPDYLEITTCRPPRIGSILVSASYFKRQPGSFTARVQRLNSLPLFLVVTLGTWFPVSSSPIYKKQKKTCQETLNGLLIMYNREERIHVLQKYCRMTRCLHLFIKVRRLYFRIVFLRWTSISPFCCLSSL